VLEKLLGRSTGRNDGAPKWNRNRICGTCLGQSDSHQELLWQKTNLKAAEGKRSSGGGGGTLRREEHKFRGEIQAIRPAGKTKANAS